MNTSDEGKTVTVGFNTLNNNRAKFKAPLMKKNIRIGMLYESDKGLYFVNIFATPKAEEQWECYEDIADLLRKYVLFITEEELEYILKEEQMRESGGIY